MDGTNSCNMKKLAILNIHFVSSESESKWKNIAASKSETCGFHVIQDCAITTIRKLLIEVIHREVTKHKKC